MVSEYCTANIRKAAASAWLNPCFNGIWSLSYQCFFDSYSYRKCLNPCFNGIWSLRTMKNLTFLETLSRLNPCFNGIWSLRYFEECKNNFYEYVLILVLMEYGLWAAKHYKKQKQIAKSLNPCFNGIWSLRRCRRWIEKGTESLNPCFNGIWSLRAGLKPAFIFLYVLILVLMEYGLWVRWPKLRMAERPWSLNPCFNGIWSLRKC